MSKEKLVRATSQIIFITIISKILGFMRDSLTASAFGATYKTDAYMTSLTIPYMVFGLFGMALTTTFIPILSDILVEKGKEHMYEFANSVMNIITLISIILCIVGWNFAPQIVRIIAPNFSSQTYQLTVSLTKLSIINILFLSLNSAYMAILQTLGDFLAPALTSVALDLPIILYLVFTKNNNITELTIATLIGSATQILIQIPWLIKHGYKLSFKINLRDSKLKKMFVLIIPVILGIGVNQLNTFVDRIMASGLEEGSISALQYANRINAIVYSIFAVSIITVMYPTISKSIEARKFEEFKYYMKKSINSINLIMIPSTVCLMVLKETIIGLLFEHGAFNREAVYMTSSALIYLSPGICILGIRDIFNRAFYALKDTKTPMKNSVFGVITNIILNIILVKKMGIRGLALATSFSIIVCTLMLILDLRKAIGGIGGKDIFQKLAKITFSSMVMGGIIYIINKFITNNIYGFKGIFISFVTSAIVGGTIYLILINILNIEEFKDIKMQIILKIKALGRSKL